MVISVSAIFADAEAAAVEANLNMKEDGSPLLTRIADDADPNSLEVFQRWGEAYVDVSPICFLSCY